MVLTYFKRFRMETDCRTSRISPRPLARGYRFFPWHENLIPCHADAKFRSFRDEIDANVFGCLGEYEGCLRLMTEISLKDGFLPEATWLVAFDSGNGTPMDFCGTVQGIRDSENYGAIQNLGITPEHRGNGLGTALMQRAMAGFHNAGLPRAFLEVTARNDGAIRLYRRLGFSKVRTVYKAVDVATELR